MALLKQDQVIFYHPFDDLQEFTTNEIWSGSGVFQSAKVINGITSEHGNFTQGNNIVFAETTIETTDNRYDSIVLKNGETVITSYIDRTTDSGILKLGTISGGTLSYNPSEFDFVNDTDSCALIPLDNTRFIVAYTDINQSRRGFARVGTVSGSTINLGSAYQFSPDSQRGNVRSDTVRKIDNNRVILCYGGSFDRDGLAVVMHVSGDVLTSGNTEVFIDTDTNSVMTNMISVDVFDSDNIVIAYGSGNTGVIRTSVGTLSGDSGITLALNEPVEVTPSGGVGIIRAMTDTKAVLLYSAESGDEEESAVYVGNLSGTTINWGASQSGEITQPGMTKFNERQCLVYSPRLFESTSEQRMAILTVNPDDSIEWTDPFAFDVEDTISVGLFPFKGDRGKHILSYRTTGLSGVAKLLLTDSQLDVQSSGGATYPTTSGYDRFVTCFWSENLNEISGTLNIDFDYRVSITPSSIKFGSGTSEWNSSGIQTLLNANNLNDGNSNFLVLDFENTSGNNWRLNTSINGSPYVDRGEQDVGSQAIINNANPTPAVNLVSGSNGQWLDELVVWAGNSGTLPKFTDLELSKLYHLGATFDQSMDKYTTEFATASGKLYYTLKNAGQIARSDLNGQNQEILISGLTSPHGLDCDKDNSKFYWSETSDIKRGDLIGNKILNVEDVGGPSKTNIHLNIPSGHIFMVSTNTAIQRTDLDGTNGTTPISSLTNASGLDIISSGATDYIYITDDTGIKRYNIDGTSPITKLSSGSPIAVVADIANNKIYWSDSDDNTIKRSDLGTVENIETIISGIRNFIPELEVSNNDNKLYFTEIGSEIVASGLIRKANLDGSNIETIVSGIVDSYGLFIDVEVTTVTSGFNLFVSGVANTIDNNVDLFTNGKNIINNNIDLTIFSKNTIAETLDLSISGAPGIIQISDNIDLFLNGFENTTDNINHFIKGSVLSQDNIDLFLSGTGIISHSGSINLFLEAIGQPNNNINLFIDGSGIIPESDNIDLFISGVLVNNNIDLFIQGPDVSGTFDITFNNLLKLSNYNPQLIGVIDGASSATIEIWNIIGGVNQLMSLDSNICYQIGSTNRFGWSTEHLPPLSYGQRQLFYRITGDNMVTFDGELVLKTPESLIWFMPPDRNDYIKKI